MKVVIAIILIIVVAGAGVLYLGSGGGNGSTSALTPTPQNNDELVAEPTAVPTPDINEVDREEPFEFSEDTAIPTVAYGPYLVAADALGGGFNSANQGRVFRTSDDTVALLYHRTARSSPDLQEIVMVHSHDGGKSWREELIVGTESSEAAYSGVMDSDGNIYVAYGREARWDDGGAINVRALNYDSEERLWNGSDAQRVVWDWPGEGAGVPILTLTEERLWLGYLKYANDAYSYLLQYADPDNQGEYSESQWSEPFVLVPSIDDINIQAKIVPYQSGLSFFYTESNSSAISWRTLRDAHGITTSWSEAEVVFTPFERDQSVRFSVSPDEYGNIHLVTSGEGIIVSHMAFNGSEWTRPTQLAVNNVYGPSIATDGRNAWTLWVKKQLSGYSQVQLRRWIDDRFWERTTSSPWTTEFGMSNPFVLLYRARNESFTDITRYASTLVSSGSGPRLDEFFERVNDYIYIGNDAPFSILPMSLTPDAYEQNGTVLEYWNGSQWTPLTIASKQKPENGTNGNGTNGNGTNGNGSTDANASGKGIKFTEPTDWQVTQVDGVDKFYVRVNNEAGETLRINPLFGLEAPIASNSRNDVIDVLISEDIASDAGQKLWYGAISITAATAEAETFDHSAKIETPLTVDESNFVDTSTQPVPLPAGSPRQYISVEIDNNETYEYQLLDGQIRHIKVLETDLKFRSKEGVSVWGTATVEVSGPGLEPQQAEIPAAYFQSPVVLNGVRVYVEITKDFNDFRLKSGGGTAKAARLMLSDSRYSLTDLTSFKWPFPGMLWGIGPYQNYYQGLVGNASGQEHVGYFTQSMPANTPIMAWRDGVIIPSTNRGQWKIALSQTNEDKGPNWHSVSPLSELDPEIFGSEIKAGEQIATVPNSDAPEIVWGEGAIYDWAPVMAEWYMAESTPVIRSYVKDWIALGPFPTVEEIDFGSLDSEDDSGQEDEFLPPLQTEYLANEATVTPLAGDRVTDELTWKRYDNIVPGVINVAEAISDYPNSGWARVTGNGGSSVAYLATYVHSPYKRAVTFNIGSSDAIKVWVKDRVIFEKDTFVRINRTGDWSVVPDSDKVRVVLDEGWNRVLFKLYQGEAQFDGVQTAQNGWQLTFRISDSLGNPLPTITINPEMERGYDPAKKFAVLPTGARAEVELSRPPAREHAWPEKADLELGEKYVFTMVDGSIRTLRLLSYDIIIPRHLITATVEVEGNGKTAEHTLQVSPGGTPVVVNGLRLYAYAWREAVDFEFERTPAGGFPLTPGKDIGFAVNDAAYPLFPDMDNYTYPYDTVFNEGAKYQAFLEPIGESEGLSAHAGVDIAAPEWANLRAMHDGVLWYKLPEGGGTEGQAWLSTTNGEKYGDPRTWFWSHLTVTKPAVPSGTFVEKGTVIFEGATATHMGTLGYIFDFGVWPFLTELWNYYKQDDFPTARYWLTLGPYEGDINSNKISSNESGNLPASVQPRVDTPDVENNRRWELADNQVNSLLRVGDITSDAPYSGYGSRFRDNSVAYFATYIYSDKDYSTSEALLTAGASRNAKVWLNGEMVFNSQTNTRTPVSKSGNTDGRQLVTYIDDYDVPITLKQGWNTLIAKTDQGLAKNTVWLFTSRISGPDGKRLPGVTFSTRNINLSAVSNQDGSVDISWLDAEHYGTFTDSYRLDVALDGAFSDLVVKNLDLGKVAEHKIEGLAKGREYFIRVKPYNSTDLGGRVNWQFMDAVKITTSGIASSSTPQNNETISVLTAPRLEIVSPSDGGTLAGQSLTVLFRASGDLREVAQARFELDGGLATTVDITDGRYQLANLTPGEHSITGWLVDESNSQIGNTEISVNFEMLSPSDASSLPWLSTNGNRIVNGEDNAVVLRGVNIENREWVWNDDKSIVFERSAIPIATGDVSDDGWGANVITLAFASGPVNRDDSVYLENLDELIEIAKSNDAYVHLVYRYAEPDTEQPAMPDQAAENAIAKLAERYKNNSTVIYGLQVEPHDVTWSELKPRFTSMIDAIRENNPRALIVVPGTEYGRKIHYVLSDPIDRDNLVYKTHPYDSWAVIQSEYRLGQVAAKYPVLIGEFGPGSQMNLVDTQLLLQFSESRGISWIGWVFHNTGCPCMLTNTDTFTPSPFGTLVKAHLQEAARIEQARSSIDLSPTP